jgi:hypothetical protein
LDFVFIFLPLHSVEFSRAKNPDPSTAIRVGNHQEPTRGRPSDRDRDEAVFVV